MQRIRALSSNCSALIDVLNFAHYNYDMEENTFVNLLAIETAAPRWRITRSVGAIYIWLIVLMIGCISIGNLMYQNWQIPRYITQPILYAIIGIVAFFLYRRHYICFRYTVTDDQLAIEQIGGSKEKIVAAISLTDITTIDMEQERKQKRGRMIDASLPPKKDAIWIFTQDRDEDIIYTISASNEFVQELKKAWHATQQTK
jgi:membrane protein YdbS with pleckstrin-like domain